MDNYDGMKQQLETTGDQFHTSLKVFESPYRASDEDEKILFEGSKDAARAKLLFDILRKNIHKWLRGLKALGNDLASSIGFNTLQFVEEDRNHWVAQVLNTLKTILKSNDGYNYSSNQQQSFEFYILLYLHLATQFEVFFPSHLPTLLGYLVPSLEQSDTQAMILLIVLKTIEFNQSESFDTITNFFDFLLETDSDMAHFLNLIKALELLFPICPTVCTKVYTSDSCKQIITSHAKRIDPKCLEDPKDMQLTRNLLKLVSGSCISDECRKFNATNYLQLLKVGSRLELKQYTELKILSTLCTVKLWNFLELKDNKSFQVTMHDLYDININYLSNRNEYNQEFLEYATEALAYLTLNPSLRIALRSNQSAIDSIIALISNLNEGVKLDNSHSSIVYGLLLILSNLMQIKIETGGTQESRTINYLKLVATPKSSNDDTKEDKDEIHNFNKDLLLNHKLLSIISKLKIIKTTSNQGTNQNSDKFILIIYYMSLNQSKQVRQELVKQGSLNILLQFLILASKIHEGQTRPLKNTSELIETRLYALRAMAKILILVNPKLAFNKYSINTCIPFLVELLGPDISKYSGQLTNKNADDGYLYNEINIVDKYESLLALTNLASLPDDKNEIKDLIISKTFEQYLNNFIIDSGVPFIQKAAWELITNLIMKPSMLAKFFEVTNSQAQKRLDLLIKLLELTDLSLQVVIAGLLANATSEFDVIAQLLVTTKSIRNKLLPVLTRVLATQAQDSDLILRLSYFLLDLVYGAADQEEILKNFRQDKALKEALSVVIKSNKDKLILEVIIEIIKFVNFD